MSILLFPPAGQGSQSTGPPSHATTAARHFGYHLHLQTPTRSPPRFCCQRNVEHPRIQPPTPPRSARKLAADLDDEPSPDGQRVASIAHALSDRSRQRDRDRTAAIVRQVVRCLDCWGCCLPRGDRQPPHCLRRHGFARLGSGDLHRRRGDGLQLAASVVYGHVISDWVFLGHSLMIREPE